MFLNSKFNIDFSLCLSLKFVIFIIMYNYVYFLMNYSILTNPDILRQLQTLQVQLSMAQAQAKPSIDQQSAILVIIYCLEFMYLL